MKGVSGPLQCRHGLQRVVCECWPSISPPGCAVPPSRAGSGVGCLPTRAHGLEAAAAESPCPPCRSPEIAPKAIPRSQPAPSLVLAALNPGFSQSYHGGCTAAKHRSYQAQGWRAHPSSPVRPRAGREGLVCILYQTGVHRAGAYVPTPCQDSSAASTAPRARGSKRTVSQAGCSRRSWETGLARQATGSANSTPGGPARQTSASCCHGSKLCGV